MSFTRKCRKFLSGKKVNIKTVLGLQYSKLVKKTIWMKKSKQLFREEVLQSEKCEESIKFVRVSKVSFIFQIFFFILLVFLSAHSYIYNPLHRAHTRTLLKISGLLSNQTETQHASIIVRLVKTTGKG